MEALLRDQQRLQLEVTRAQQEAREAKKSPQEQPDLLTQIQRIQQTAAALGMEKKSSGGATAAPAQTSSLEQIADILDTQGGKVLVEKLTSRLLGDGSSSEKSEEEKPAPPPPPPPPPQPAPMQLMQPQYVEAPPFASTGGPQVFYGGPLPPSQGYYVHPPLAQGAPVFQPEPSQPQFAAPAPQQFQPPPDDGNGFLPDEGDPQGDEGYEGEPLPPEATGDAAPSPEADAPSPPDEGDPQGDEPDPAPGEAG